MFRMNRYSRQMILPGVGEGGQKQLASAHLLVVGAGGLGCPILQYLVGAGVGQITVLDPDHVEESNLHRQPLYRMSDLGRAKVLAAQDHLQAANPDVSVLPKVGALNPQNALALVQQADVVLDAADSFAVSYILSDTCKMLKTPLISASALRQAGYVGGFCGSAPSLRAVFPDLPQNMATCESLGVLGPVVGLVGALQAQMALQVLLQHTPSPLGRMVTLDLRDLQFGGFSFQTATEPETVIQFISRSDVKGSDQVIELRDIEERPTPLVAGALRCKPDAVETLMLDPGRRIVLCCSTGLRAWRAGIKLSGIRDARIVLLAERASA